MGPSDPATSLRGNMCWVDDCVAGVAGESGEVSGSVGELDEGEGEGWREVVGRERAPPRGAEGRGLRLVEEEEPFCLGGKVHRRTLWVEQALLGRACSEGPKRLGIRGPPTACHSVSGSR